MARSLHRTRDPIRIEFIPRGSSTRPGSDSALAGGLGDGLGRRIAERAEHRLGPTRISVTQVAHRLTKGLQTEVGRPLGPIHAIQERREFDELAARIHEIEVQHLLPSHGLEPTSDRSHWEARDAPDPQPRQGTVPLNDGA